MNTGTIIAGLAGLAVTVGAVSFVATDLTQGANATVDSANLHQLATALEVYYTVHQAYPQLNGGEALLHALFNESYIRNIPANPSAFVYEPLNDGQDYSLKVVSIDGESSNEGN